MLQAFIDKMDITYNEIKYVGQNDKLKAINLILTPTFRRENHTMFIYTQSLEIFDKNYHNSIIKDR